MMAVFSDEVVQPFEQRIEQNGRDGVSFPFRLDGRCLHRVFRFHEVGGTGVGGNYSKPIAFVLLHTNCRSRAKLRRSPSLADVLQITGLDDASIAHAVLVLQLAVDDIAEDLGVPMRMLAEALAGPHHVIVWPRAAAGRFTRVGWLVSVVFMAQCRVAVARRPMLCS